MLSDTLFEASELLKEQALHYTTGVFAQTYTEDVKDEIDDIITRIKTLQLKLDKSDFDGSYRF